MEIQIDDIPAMYVVSPHGPQQARAAFHKLESAINWQLNGRKFYGTMFNGHYRANLAIIDKHEPEKFGFPIWTIPGGKYFREKINDWEKHVNQIAPKFEEMMSKVELDPTRPAIEFYRSQAELYLLVPIK